MATQDITCRLPSRNSPMTIRKVMDEPLETWEMNMYEPKYPTSSEKLFVLVLASLLHHQQQLTGKDAPSILSEHGLQLVPSTEFELLKPLLPTVKDDGNSEEKQGNPMTLEYSKLFTTLNSYHWQYVEYHRFIRLIEMPESLRSSQGAHQGIDEIADQPTIDATTNESTVAVGQDEHTVEIQEGREYKDVVREAIAQLLLYYNVEIITDFSFYISEARKYHPLASKMAKLRNLTLYRDESVPDQHVQDSIAFIRLNKASFPGKSCLQLGFDYRWSSYDTSAFTSIKESRRSMFSAMKSKLDLYKALGEPEDLEIGFIPGFYGLADDLSTERLIRLDDEDQFRIEMGEGPDMEAFLRRCRRLDTLRMEIGHPYVFSWAAQHARDHADSGRSALSPALSTDLLPRLDDLYFWSDRPYRFSIYALNDSMVAFAKSLGSVCIINNHEFRTRGQSTNPLNSWILQKDDEKSRMIRTAPLANKIGDWPFPLPRLRSLRLDLRCTSFIHIGSLDQCVNLEELDLRYGAVGEAPRAIEPNDDDPNADPRRQAPLDTNLYPKWNLPKLKLLHLDGAPALLFDYDSLERMPNLETMTLSCKKKVDLEERLKDIPRLSMHSSRFYSSTLSQKTAPADDSAAATSASTPPNGTIWTRTWTLPKLKTLEMEGPPATVFTFDWLKGCPSLTSVTLNLHLYGSPQRLPLIALSPDTYALPPSTEESGTKSPQNKTQDTAAVTGADADTEVFMDSKLESLHLKGPWEITASDLTTLMTDNAPFLKTLTLNKVQRRGGMSVGAFVQAFKDADEICRKRYGEDWDARPDDVADYDYEDGKEIVEDCLTEDQGDSQNDTGAESDLPTDSQASIVGAPVDVLPERPLPGRSLLTIEADYTLGRRAQTSTQLEAIDNDDAEEYRRCGIRVYCFSRCCVVDKYDKAWYNRNKGSEWWDAYFK
ncbi:hypothetical protein BGW39_008082 [Mortierella sp. 14UC]|nr:hypothetical protein BGW39_008082 [Mortierella sp. 14UC]